MVLPAPVSPVTHVKPGPSGTRADSMTPRFSMASSCSTSRSASAKAAARGSSAEVIGSIPALPVANTRQVSEVEVSLSTVTALKLTSIAGCSRLANRTPKPSGSAIVKSRRP